MDHIFSVQIKFIHLIDWFAKLNNFINEVYVRYKNLLFPLPINFKCIKIITNKNEDYIIYELKKISKKNN